MAAAQVPVDAAARLLRHPAHRQAQGRADPVRRGRRRRLAQLRQHAVRAARPVLQGPGLGAHHRLEVASWRPTTTRRSACSASRRTRSRPPPTASSSRWPPTWASRARSTTRRSGVVFGETRRADVGDPYFGGVGPDAQRLPAVRRVHDRMPPQRQEHAGQELPVPRREQRRRDPSAHDGGGRPPAARRRLRDRDPSHQPAVPPAPQDHRRAGRVRGQHDGHPEAAAPHARPRHPAGRLRAARAADPHELRGAARGDRRQARRRLQPRRRHHVVVPPRRAHPRRAGALRQGLQRDVADADRAHRRQHRHAAVAGLAPGDVARRSATCSSSTTCGTGRSARSSPS